MPFGIIIGIIFVPAGVTCRTTSGQYPVQESLGNTLVGPTFGKKTFDGLGSMRVKVYASDWQHEIGITSANTLRWSSGELFRPSSKIAGYLHDLNILNILFDLENWKRQK